MYFEKFIKERKVKKSTKDFALAKALLSTAEDDLKFLHLIKINELSARKVMSNYYDVLRSVLEAMAAIDGFKVYSHEAFTYYLKELRKEEITAMKFERFRKLRNSINYYGKSISPEEVEVNKSEILGVMKKLINSARKEIKG